MMKFFAIVALVLISTANAGTVAWGGATRATSYVAAVAGGNLVVKFTPEIELALSGSIILTPSFKLFAGDGTTTCTLATSETTDPTILSSTLSASTSTQVLTVVLNNGATDIVKAGAEGTLTCTGAGTVALAANPVALTAVTFGISTTNDLTALSAQTGYTTTAGFIDFTATRASRVAGADPGNLVVTIKPKVGLARNTGTITLTPSTNIFDADSTTATTCTVVITGDATTAPTMTAAVSLTSTTANTQKVILTMGGNPTDTIEVDEVATITCTGNMAAVNGAAASTVKFAVATSGDTTGLTAAQAGGYTIASASAASSTASVSMLTMLALAGVAMRQ